MITIFAVPEKILTILQPYILRSNAIKSDLASNNTESKYIKQMRKWQWNIFIWYQNKLAKYPKLKRLLDVVPNTVEKLLQADRKYRVYQHKLNELIAVRNVIDVHLQKCDSIPLTDADHPLFYQLSGMYPVFDVYFVPDWQRIERASSLNIMTEIAQYASHTPLIFIAADL